MWSTPASLTHTYHQSNKKQTKKQNKTKKFPSNTINSQHKGMRRGNARSNLQKCWEGLGVRLHSEKGFTFPHPPLTVLNQACRLLCPGRPLLHHSPPINPALIVRWVLEIKVDVSEEVIYLTNMHYIFRRAHHHAVYMYFSLNSHSPQIDWMTGPGSQS